MWILWSTHVIAGSSRVCAVSGNLVAVDVLLCGEHMSQRDMRHRLTSALCVRYGAAITIRNPSIRSSTRHHRPARRNRAQHHRLPDLARRPVASQTRFHRPRCDTTTPSATRRCSCVIAPPLNLPSTAQSPKEISLTSPPLRHSAQPDFSGRKED
jgi:hypothetical protein